jgi:hypothetical protein
MSSDRTTAASDADLRPPASPATPTQSVLLPLSDATPVTDDAGVTVVTALADDLKYTLTAGQALEHFAAGHRKVPSLRTIQRYCIEGRIAAQKIRTTYGSEWLINGDSLARLIEAEPIITAVASVAAVAVSASPASPVAQPPLDSVHVTHDNGAADVAIVDELASPRAEPRRLADVLIENAKLFAEVEGRDAIIAELKEDRNFLREEVREARRTRDDVKNIAERMLDTLKTMAIGRLAAAAPASEPVPADIIDPGPHRA